MLKRDGQCGAASRGPLPGARLARRGTGGCAAGRGCCRCRASAGVGASSGPRGRHRPLGTETPPIWRSAERAGGGRGARSAASCTLRSPRAAAAAAAASACPTCVEPAEAAISALCTPPPRQAASRTRPALRHSRARRTSSSSLSVSCGVRCSGSMRLPVGAAPADGHCAGATGGEGWGDDNPSSGAISILGNKNLPPRDLYSR